MGRISRVQAGDVDVEYQYNSDNRVSIIFNNMNFSISHFSYDNAGRRTNLHYRSFYGETATINNQYDSYAAARLKQQQLSFNGTPTRVHNYDYDIIDQISSEQTLVNGNQIDYNSYSYNGFGDRTCGVENVTHIFDVNYPDANTIRKTSDSLTKAFLSDTRGNLIQIKERRIPTLFFEYDTDNNMIGAEINGTNWTFRYNSQNQMYYSKIVDEYDCVIDERFYIYDGLDCIAETDTDGEILREYIRIGNVGGIVAEIRHNDTTCAPGYESGTFYYHYNHRGDVIAVSSHNGGSIIFKADYDAYGKITRIDSGSFEPRYTFSTKRYFKDLGLYYYGYRWYLPELGRWTTKDPIGYQDSLNLYGFCGNDSVNMWDLYGLKIVVGKARVLKGNKNLIGKAGGFSGNKNIFVTPNSAAVDPAQWGGKAKLRPRLSEITGTLTDDSGNEVGSFEGISDVIGGKSPIKGMNVRDALKKMNPGLLLIELPSAEEDLGIVNVTITIPDDYPCPEGTKLKCN